MSEEQTPFRHDYEYYKPCGCAEWLKCDCVQLGVEPSQTEAGAILRRVADIVDGPRNRTHGNKERSFAGIAKGWRRAFGWEVRPSDVALAQVIVKEQRMRHGEHSPEALCEHVEDILGYWAIYYELRRLEGEPVPDETLPTEQELTSLMRDPSYWRDRDPAVVAQVTEGFRKLYPK